MAKRGRKPLPPELRTGRQRIEGTAQAIEGRPECPPHLLGDARDKWGEIIPMLEEAGILSRADTDAIALYCETFARWLECVRRLEDPDNWVIVSPKGFILNSPWINMRNNFAKEMGRLLAEFGLTPSARSRVAANPKQTDDPLTAFLKGGA